MDLSAVSPSPSPSGGRPVCRFCLDDDESASGMIKPCNCRGTVALVHPSCLEMWVEKSKNLVCQLCQIGYEQESVGLKKICEWTLPKPPPELPYESIFHLMFIWIAYILLMLFVFVTFGFSGMMTWVDYHYMILYGFCFHDVFQTYRRNVPRIAKHWYQTNTVYKLKDTSTEEERRELDEIQDQPLQCYFCPQGILRIAPLIYLCKCRGAAVHSICTQKYLGRDNVSRILVCSRCNELSRLNILGLRKFSEWTWPQPISDSPIHKAEFCVVFAFTFYLLRFVKVWISIGNQEMITWMASHAYWVYWVNLSLFSVVLSCEALLVARNWYAENTAYKFRDRSTVLERKAPIWKNSQPNETSGERADE